MRKPLPGAVEFLAPVVSAVVLALALPSELFPEGLAAFGWLALFPSFWFTRRHAWVASAAGGALFATTLFLTSCSWLLGFHPLAFPIVLLVMVPQYAAVFALSSLLWRWVPPKKSRLVGIWFQAALWAVFEAVRNLGWLAFPYGSLASTQAFFPVAFQSADLLGTTGLTYLLALVSAAGAALPLLPWLDLALAGVLLVLNFGYGWWILGQDEGGGPVRVALVQNAQDPWKGGVETYSGALDTLLELSTKALADKPDLVVWPETAFVPGIDWHTRYRPDPTSWQLVKRLEVFLANSATTFVLGNDHGVLAPDGKTRLDYNAALLWNGGWADRYLKNRLVPFTESLPWKDQLPWLRQLLERNGSHFWEAGTTFEVLHAGPLVLGTPICYEDAFPDASRAFALAGANLLVNLTNDSWTTGTAARNQHLALAVFRSAETRLPLVRAGNDGRTAVIDSRGRVTASLAVGVRGVLAAPVWVGISKPTIYTRWGDFGAIFLSFLLGIPAFWALERRWRGRPRAI
ncbi:MAG: apolipoprotein N-acyltransferase [Spirochaetales bacterium]